MSSILTIDWDFFNMDSILIRDNKYPRVIDGSLDCVPDNKLWNSFLDPSWLDSSAYNKISDYISGKSFKQCYITENHGFMYDYAHKIGHVDKVYNIDFHHDCYFSGVTPHCDNWLSLLKQEFDLKCYWLHRPDSCISSFGKEFSGYHTDSVPDFIKLLEQDNNIRYIHICRSDLYSPPALDCFFIPLCLKAINSSETTVIEHIKQR